MDFINLALFFILLIAVFFNWRKYLFLKSKENSVEDLANVDSFVLAFLNRRGSLKHNDMTAALFRLHQKGAVSMELIEARSGYLEDDYAPEMTYYFVLLPKKVGLTAYETELIDLLFVNEGNGKRSFTLDSLPFPTATERKQNWKIANQYELEERQFHKGFKKWEKLVSKDKEMREYIVENNFRTSLMKWGIPVWILACLMNAYSGTSDLGDLILPGAGLFLGWGIILLLKKIHLSFPAYILLGIGALIFLNYQVPPSLLLLTITLFVIAGVLPVLNFTPNGQTIYHAMKKFRKSVNGGSFVFPSSRVEYERWVEHSLALNLFFSLESNYGDDHPSNLYNLSPLYNSLEDTAKTFNYPHQYFKHKYTKSINTNRHYDSDGYDGDGYSDSGGFSDGGFGGGDGGGGGGD